MIKLIVKTMQFNTRPLLRRVFLSKELLNAVGNNDINMIESLLTIGANVDTPNKIGETPLHFFCKNGNYNLVKLMLNKKADINKKCDYYGNTPLILAIKKKHENIINLLIDRKVDINLTNYAGINPIASSLLSKQYSFFDCLIKTGADINEKYSKLNGNTPLLLAIGNNSFEWIQNMLYIKADVNIHNDDKISPLIQSVLRGNLNITKLLIDNNAIIHHKDCEGKTALFEATIRNRFKIINMLLKKNSDINHMNLHGDTPLTFNARNGNQEMVKFLIDKKADIHKKTIMGRSVLNVAIESNNIPLIKYLLTKNLDINDKDDYQRTPLYIAVKNSFKEMVSYLLDNKADPTIVDNRHKTPLDIAKYYKNEDIINLLSIN